ncbi:ABC transporter permease [Pseudoxanthobacter sp.]|uniref:ABC transporter permease n=1 Tax=Pseudoxanthobacter sp. TaxID=1925742 RepID=UPI002FE259EC
MLKSPAERLTDLLLAVLAAVTLTVLYAPVLISALFSVVPYDQAGLHWQAAGFDWYRALPGNASVMAAVRASALVGVLSVAAATVLAVVMALYVEWQGAIGRRFIEIVVYLPFLMPPIVTGLSLLIFLDRLGLSRGLATVVIGHTALVLAVLYRLVLTRLRALPKSLVEASADLGATRLQTFRHVVWPQLRSAVATGALLALTVSFDETLVTVFLAGDATTLPLRLWGMMRVGFTPEINALVTVVLAASIGLAVVVALRLKPDSRGEDQ